MSESKPKKIVTLSDDDVVTERPEMGRRSSMALLGASLLGAAGVAAGAMPQRAEAQYTDRDPSDPAGRGRGCPGWSDSDPNDPAGCGRRTGITDSDPNDPAGRGRGRRSCSDADPYDPAGRGRHC